MLNTPSISVVMGVYNGAGLLPETIGSVLAQTERDFELIVVNDGSSEPEVAQILADYESHDERVKVIRKQNEGLTRALISGCNAARGRYIARIDAGDAMTPERLGKQKSLLDVHPDAVLATCWTGYYGPEWEPLYTANSIPPGDGDTGGWVASFPLDGDERGRSIGPTSHPSVMMRATAYKTAGGYRSQFYCGQDWDLWYRMAERGKFAGIQSELYRCRIFPDGISMRNVKRQRQIHACSRGAFLARRRGEDETPFLETAARLRPSKTGRRTACPAGPSAAGYYFIGEALRRNGDPRCRKYLTQAVKTNPGHLKAWFRMMQSAVM